MGNVDLSKMSDEERKQFRKIEHKLKLIAQNCEMIKDIDKNIRTNTTSMDSLMDDLKQMSDVVNNLEKTVKSLQ